MPSAETLRDSIPARSAPLRRWAVLSLTLIGALLALESLAAPLTVRILAADGRPLAGAVVTAHDVSGKARPAAPTHATIDQVNLAFVPDLLVVPVGSTIGFPNSDSVSHQIYSFSPAKRFQLPLYRGTPYPPVRFDAPGLVTLGCNIHDAMLAYIVVTDGSLFGRTDASGAWSVADVPPGAWRLSVWHPRLRDDDARRETPVTVGESAAEVEIRLTRPLKPMPVGVRPHSWDAY